MVHPNRKAPQRSPQSPVPPQDIEADSDRPWNMSASPTRRRQHHVPKDRLSASTPAIWRAPCLAIAAEVRGPSDALSTAQCPFNMGHTQPSADEQGSTPPHQR